MNLSDFGDVIDKEVIVVMSLKFCFYFVFISLLFLELSFCPLFNSTLIENKFSWYLKSINKSEDILMYECRWNIGKSILLKLKIFLR